MVSGVQAIKYITYLLLSQAAHQEILSKLNSCRPQFNRVSISFNQPSEDLHSQLFTRIFPVRHSQSAPRHPEASGHPSNLPPSPTTRHSLLPTKTLNPQLSTLNSKRLTLSHDSVPTLRQSL